MEIHRILGKGYLESLYKDAMEYEQKLCEIPYAREKKFIIKYKDVILNHSYFADFIVFDKILLGIKSCNGIVNGHIKQTLYYLAVSKLNLGLIINFGEDSLKSKRILL